MNSTVLLRSLIAIAWALTAAAHASKNPGTTGSIIQWAVCFGFAYLFAFFAAGAWRD